MSDVTTMYLPFEMNSVAAAIREAQCIRDGFSESRHDYDTTASGGNHVIRRDCSCVERMDAWTIFE